MLFCRAYHTSLTDNWRQICEWQYFPQCIDRDKKNCETMKMLFLLTWRKCDRYGQGAVLNRQATRHKEACV